MDKKFWCLVLFLGISLILIPQVFSLSTEITIKTLPYHDVQVTPCKPLSTFLSYGTMKKTSDQYGDAKFIFSSEESTFDLIVYVKKDNVNAVPPKKFEEGYIAGEPIYLEIAPANYEFIKTPKAGENLTVNISNSSSSQVDVEVNLTEQTQELEAMEETQVNNEESDSLTGAAISEEEVEFSISKNMLYYVGGGILILLVFGFIGLKMYKKGIHIPPREVRVKKLSELKYDEDKDFNAKKRGYYPIEDDRHVGVKIANAEMKIKEAEAELRKIRNEQKIKDVERRIKEDQDKLNRLREGKE